jgi:hypothetical protein
MFKSRFTKAVEVPLALLLLLKEIAAMTAMRSARQLSKNE